SGGTLVVSGPLAVSIAGNYVQTPTGTLQLGMGGTVVGQWDELNISGPASLSGTLRLVPYGAFTLHDNETFTLLTAASVTGTFNPVTSLVGGAGVSLVYQPTDVVLDA